MTLKPLALFKSKFLKPCKRILQYFRFKKPISIKPLNSFRRHHKRRLVLRAVLSPFSFRSKNREQDDVSELRSMGARTDMLLFPSPLTPAYVKINGVLRREIDEDEDEDEVEDACRSFENYLVEMMVEEGKVRDLMDVEDLLYCWKNLKCPVFKNLVCRFYGELCKDLFSS